MKRVLVLGATGMLGSAVLRFFAVRKCTYETFGSVRSNSTALQLPNHLLKNLVTAVDVMNSEDIIRLFARVQPHIVINCVGLVKQLETAKDPLSALPINAVLPHRLARLCSVSGARLVHISTDCVFSGKRGNYHENDVADADDLYGRSKFLGEVDYPNAITLRTSIIGPQLSSTHGLIGWFLSQAGTVYGYTRAIFSGLPTVELARVISDYVLPNQDLHGVYHVGAAPISKYELLTLVADVYCRPTRILPDENVVIDRSLDSLRFEQATGYSAPSWPNLIRDMHAFG